MSASLPPGFADLEPFAPLWIGLETMESRYRARQDMPFDALKQFYDVAVPRLADIMAHLDAFGSDTLPSAEARLYRLALGLVEAAQAVEFFGAARLPGAPYPHDIAVGGKAALSD
ncbi:MAG TPA: hypothetical protein DCG90_14125 [Sphingobium sp.]|uniref:hypothetical protein n=1 Tax=Sphingobium sp. TaxID=1912891 RepID=UPI000ED9D171|nr:hypothetical protein [Sphingobium sp.]HAF42877.1 hypothetical protein [Sphingobium sp.]